MSNYSDQMKHRLKSKDAVIGIVGLGYVGLPLAVVVARKGFKVIGFDILESRVSLVNNGESYIGDVDGDELRTVVESGVLQATADYSQIKKCDVICIAVPTPLDKFQQPDVKYVVSSSEEIAKNAKKGAMIILESTTYPGTTEEVVVPILKTGDLNRVQIFLLLFLRKGWIPETRIITREILQRWQEVFLKHVEIWRPCSINPFLMPKYFL